MGRLARRFAHLAAERGRELVGRLLEALDFALHGGLRVLEQRVEVVRHVLDLVHGRSNFLIVFLLLRVCGAEHRLLALEVLLVLGLDAAQLVHEVRPERPQVRLRLGDLICERL